METTTWSIARSVLRSAGVGATVCMFGAVTGVSQIRAQGGGGGPSAAPIAAGTQFGSGCGGVGGQPPTIEITPPLRPGFSSTLQLQNLAPNEAAVLMFSDTRTNWNGLPLPVALDGIGLPGCELLVGAQNLIPFLTGNGHPSFSVSVPLTTVLAAHPVYLQAMFQRPGVLPVGMTRGYDTRFTPLPSPISMVSTITQHGITFQFASPVPAGHFVNGDWFVVGPATLIGMQPPCVTVNGRVMNGAMINPDASTRRHGYDNTLYDAGNSALYIPALNVALGLSINNPLSLQPNQSLIKVISNTDPAFVPQIATCAVLTVLAETPPEGSFRPPYAGTDHLVRYDEQLLDWNQLAALAPATGMPDINTQLPLFERPWLDHSPGWTSRYLHPVLNMPGYGRDFTSLYNEAALLCLTNVPLVERKPLAIRLVQIGIDCFGNVKSGCYWEGVGGHGSGRKFPILFAGALLHDNDMLAIGQDYVSQRMLNGNSTAFFGEDCQTFYVAQTGSTINWGYGGYVAADLGVPEYGFSHVNWPSSDHELWSQDSYRRCCTANAWVGGVLAARVMGLVPTWNHPALFDYMDRYMQTEPSGWTRSWSGWCERMWDLHRASY